MTTPSILRVADDLFADTFPAKSWSAWRTCLAALFGLGADDQSLALFRRCTGRDSWPVEACREGWLIVGRRGGKSRLAALVAVYLACFRDYSSVLAPGERGTVMLLAADRRQARVAFRYVSALIDGVEMLACTVVGRTAEALHLSNRISIEVHTASYRSTRGYTVVAAILDELAYWRDETSANPDEEVLAALRPGMATVPGALLLAISSPHARRGALWNAYQQHHGAEGADVLVWQADSRTMNPTLSGAFVERAYAEDPARAAAEYGAEFRSDLEAFVSREALEPCVEPGVFERRRVEGVSYAAFVDPSGGSRDSMTLAVAHLEDDRAILDVVRERRPPFSPDAVVREFAELLRAYGLSRVVGDRYAGEWPRERFREHGIEYRTAAQPKSDLYGTLLPAINSGRVSLLDSSRLKSQLLALERRTARGGRDSIDHPPRGHDDVANAAAGALVEALRERPSPVLEIDLAAASALLDRPSESRWLSPDAAPWRFPGASLGDE